MVETLIERLRAYPKDKNGNFDSLTYLMDGGEAADRLEALEREKEELRKERDAARQALEHDRSKVIEAVNQFSDAFARRSWLLDSRGSYEWDDERYRDEFRGAYDELAAPIQQLKAIGKDWSNCPTNHDEIMRARNDWLARAETAERQLAERDADLARKDAALKPFADVCGYFDGHVKDDDDISIALRSIKARHVRAALAGSGDGWRDMADAPKDGTFLAVNAGEIERWDHHADPGIVTRTSEDRAFTCHRLEDGKFVDEFGEVYLSDGRVIDSEDLTADDNVLRLVGWRPLPASPSTAGER